MTFLLSTIQGRTNKVIALSAICALAIFCLGGGAAGQNPVRANSVVPKTQNPTRKQKGKAEEAPDKAQNSFAVLWQDPLDLEVRDLFYGIGGREGAPDAEAKYTFVSDKGSPNDSNPKILVKDEEGRSWTVKFGPEVKSETAATRLVWAAGYHTDQDYFVQRAMIEGFTRLETRNMRFERENDGFKKVGRWDWKANPFVGTREFDGLRTLMALLHNVDLSELNTKIVRLNHLVGGQEKDIYYVNDLGAALGSTGAWFTKMPWLTKARSESKGVPQDYVKSGFISGVKNGEVNFQITRRLANQILDGVKVEHARWMGNLLARLSEKQLTDAFRSGGFSESEVAIYVNEIRDRIRQLQNLESGVVTSR